MTISAEAIPIRMRPIDTGYSADWDHVMKPYMREKMLSVMSNIVQWANSLGGWLELRGSAGDEITRCRYGFPEIGMELDSISRFYLERDRGRRPNDPDPQSLYQKDGDVNFKAPQWLVSILGKLLVTRYGVSLVSRSGSATDTLWKGRQIYSAALSGLLSRDPPLPYASYGYYWGDPRTRGADVICVLNLFPAGEPADQFIDRRAEHGSFTADGGVRQGVDVGRGYYPFSLRPRPMPKFVHMGDDAFVNYESRLKSGDPSVRLDAAGALGEIIPRAVRRGVALAPFTAFCPDDGRHAHVRELSQESLKILSGTGLNASNVGFSVRDIEVGRMLNPSLADVMMRALQVDDWFSAEQLKSMDLTVQDYRIWRKSRFA